MRWETRERRHEQKGAKPHGKRKIAPKHVFFHTSYISLEIDFFSELGLLLLGLWKCGKLRRTHSQGPGV